MNTVLITGANGLLGKEFARAFMNRGVDAHIYLTDMGAVCPLDVRSEADWLRWADLNIDILVNCAGITNNSKQDGFNDVFGAWDEIMDVNLKGTMLGCKIIGRQMVERGSGCIINIASQYGLVAPHFDIYGDSGIFQPAAYSVSKAGVLGLTRYLACLWGRSGVRVNAIVPGGVYNGQDEEFVRRFEAHSPMGRMAQPDEIVGAALYLAENTYVNGASIVVDGGWSVW